MNIRQFLLIMRARWKMACTVFAGVVLTSILLVIVLPNKYTATAALVVDSKQDPVTAAGGASDQVLASYINTQSDVITSVRVGQRVAKALKLDEEPGVRQKWIEKTGGQGDIFVWLAHGLLAGKNLVVGAASGGSATRQTNVIEITAKSRDPKMAAAIANGFATAAIQTNIELKVEPAKLYSAWFDQRLAALRTDLEAKQKRLSDFQNASGIVATDDKLDTENARLAELSTQLVAVQSQRQDSQSRQRQVSGENDFLPEVLQSPLIASLKDNLRAAEAKKTELAGRLGKNHPDYQAAEAEVTSLRARIATETSKIVASLGSTTQVNMRRESDIRQALEAQKKRVLDMKHDHDEAAVLYGDVTAAQRDLDAVSQRLAVTNLESQAQQTNVVLLTAATPPLDPSSPKLLIFLGVGIFLGGILGIASAMLVEKNDERLREEDDLVGLLGVPVLGRIRTVKPGPSTGLSRPPVPSGISSTI
jgi:chain length determinant protein EpsF